MNNTGFELAAEVIGFQKCVASTLALAAIPEEEAKGKAKPKPAKGKGCMKMCLFFICWCVCAGGACGCVCVGCQWLANVWPMVGQWLDNG